MFYKFFKYCFLITCFFLIQLRDVQENLTKYSNQKSIESTDNINQLKKSLVDSIKFAA